MIPYEMYWILFEVSNAISCILKVTFSDFLLQHQAEL